MHETLDSLKTLTLATLVRAHRDEASLSLATAEDIAALPWPGESVDLVITGEVSSAWLVKISVRGEWIVRIYGSAQGGTWITSKAEAIDYPRGLIRTRSGSLYSCSWCSEEMELGDLMGLAGLLWASSPRLAAFLDLPRAYF